MYWLYFGRPLLSAYLTWNFYWGWIVGSRKYRSLKQDMELWARFLFGKLLHLLLIGGGFVYCTMGGGIYEYMKTMKLAQNGQ
jgi:hypothetical protein